MPLVALGVLLAIPANACGFMEAPPVPSDFISGTILQGTVVGTETERGRRYITVEIERVVQGKYPAEIFVFSFQPYDGSGMCPPPGPGNLKRGDRIVIYSDQVKNGAEPDAWMSYDYARKHDPRVRSSARNIPFAPLTRLLFALDRLGDD